MEQMEKNSRKAKQNSKSQKEETEEKLKETSRSTIWGKFQNPRRKVENHIAEEITNLEDERNKIKQEFAAIYLSAIERTANQSIENLSISDSDIATQADPVRSIWNLFNLMKTSPGVTTTDSLRLQQALSLALHGEATYILQILSCQK